jgi:hypothetical protein
MTAARRNIIIEQYAEFRWSLLFKNVDYVAAPKRFRVLPTFGATAWIDLTEGAGITSTLVGADTRVVIVVLASITGGLVAPSLGVFDLFIAPSSLPRKEIKGRATVDPSTGPI